MIFRDITEQKMVEMRLDQLIRHSRLILDSAGEGIVGLDPQGRQTFVNGAAARMLGYEAKELVGQSAHALWHHSKPDGTPYAEQECPICAARHDGIVRREDREVFWRKDGVSFPVEYVVTPVRERGALIGICMVFRDITERKKAEEEIRQSYLKLEKMMNATISVITRLVEMKDSYTVGHERRVAELASRIAMELGLSQARVEGVRMAGYLHDIGKVLMPKEILTKPGKLESEELALVRTHSQAGYEILKGLEFPDMVSLAIMQHHERLDGSGYPLGLAGDTIAIEGRILGVADVVESMSNPRPYREAFPIEEALKEISRGRDVMYDSDVVDACLRLFKEKGFKPE